MKRLTLLTHLVLFSFLLTDAQTFNSINGDVLPTKGTIRVLFVFAEIDCSNCPSVPTGQPSNYYCKGSAVPEWPAGEIPQGLDDYISPDISLLSQVGITKYYNEVSFGNLNILGDYYDEILSIPCDIYANNSDVNSGTEIVMQRLNEEYASGNVNFQSTHSGKTLKDFDLIGGEENHFVEKNIASGNGIIDAIAIVWRNNNLINYQSCGAGYAFQTWSNLSTSDVLTENGSSFYYPLLVGSWSDCRGTGSLFIQEFAHTLFGGNHWHASGGAGAHTFPFVPSIISVNGQAPATSTAVCGWDRMFTGWESPTYQNPSEYYPIPVLDENLNHTSGDLLTPTSNEQIFILRDHVTTGDAVRIKLPHLNWQNLGDKKNQYLWVENRQQIKEYDVQQYGDFDCVEDWIPGMYSYIQVGKDILISFDDVEELLTNDYDAPNGLGSWLFSVSAEGNFDYKYRTDLAATGVETNFCAGGNHIPKETDSPETLPNPFTGASDLYKTRFDHNDDGVLGDNDNYDIGGAEMKNGIIEFNLSESGDGEDAFSLNGNSKIGIGRNPSAMPIYTRRSIVKPENYDPVLDPIPSIESYENRIIKLNGISVEIIEEIWNNDLQANDLKVKVRWNDFEVDRNTRWCGNIVLQQDINASFQSQLIVGNERVITLDQGKSPIDYQGIAQPDGTFLFAEPTVLTIKDGTKLEMKGFSNITIKNNSTMVIDEGAEVIMKNGSCIVVEDSGILELRGNDITMMGEDALIIIKNGGTLRTADGVDFTFNVEDDIVNGVIVNKAGGYIAFEAGNIVELGEGSNFVLTRPSFPETKSILMLEEASLSIQGDHKLELKNIIIEYNNHSKIHIEDGVVELDYIEMVHGGNGFSSGITGIEGTNLSECSIYSLESTDIGTTAKFDGYTSPGTHNLNSLMIKNGDYGVVANDLGAYLSITGSSFQGLDDAAAKLSNLKYVLLDQNDVEDSNSLSPVKGYDLEHVGFADINRGSVRDCITGISALNSNVFLRRGQTIEHNTNGIVFEDSGTANYALTVGDIGCANIIFNDVGVSGENIIMNIDAIEHAANNNDPNPKANRFNGNNVLFDICYTHPTLVNDNPTILMKGNYFGGGGYLSISSSFTRNLSNGGPPCHFGVPFDDADFVTVEPTFNCEFIPQPAPLPFPDKVKCIIEKTDVDILVHEQSRSAHLELVDGDLAEAQLKYQPIADLTSQEANYDPSCLNKIYFARCMALADIGDAFNPFIALLSSEEWDENVVVDNVKQTMDYFTIFPNPATDHINIQNKFESEFEITIINTYGKEVYRAEFIQQLQLDTERLERGIYFVSILDKSSKEKIQKKVVIQ